MLAGFNARRRFVFGQGPSCLGRIGIRHRTALMEARVGGFTDEARPRMTYCGTTKCTASETSEGKDSDD